MAKNQIDKQLVDKIKDSFLKHRKFSLAKELMQQIMMTSMLLRLW